jgi:hypothetical protein
MEENAMTKKIAMPILVVLILCSVFPGAVLAQNETTISAFSGIRRSIGMITSLGTDQITIKNRLGNEIVLAVDARTRYLGEGGSAIGFGDLAEGRWILAAGRLAGGSSLSRNRLARLVILLPENYDPSQRYPVKANGLVTGVDPANNSFTMVDRDGETLTFAASDETSYYGLAGSLSALQQNMRVSVAALEVSGSEPLAMYVYSRYDLDAHVGKITAIDSANNQFSLDTPRRGTLKITVNSDTRYQGRNGTITGLADLQVGMYAGVLVRNTGQTLLAVTVVAGPQLARPAG